MRQSIGRTLSMVSTSFEKRLTTRPRGVVSNSSMGHRNTYDRSVSCSTLEQKMHPRASVREQKKYEVTGRLNYKCIFFFRFNLNWFSRQKRGQNILKSFDNLQRRAVLRTQMHLSMGDGDLYRTYTFFFGNNYRKQLQNDDPQIEWQCIVNCIYVLGKTVDNATQRCDVEHFHGPTQSAMEQHVVHVAGAINAAQWKDQGG